MRKEISLIHSYPYDWKYQLNELVTDIWTRNKERCGISNWDDIWQETRIKLHLLSVADRKYTAWMAFTILKCTLIDIFLRSKAYCDSYEGKIERERRGSDPVRFHYYEELVDRSFENRLVDDISARELIETLAPDLRFPICLHLCGYTQEEIGGEIGRSRSSVSKRVNSATKALRKQAGIS